MAYVGKINTYTCRSCGFVFVTIDRDKGTTPMTTACRNPGGRPYRGACRGTAFSDWYSVDQTLVPTYEWYKPGKAEIRTIKKLAVLDHIRFGGLLLRKIPEKSNGSA